MDKSSSMPKPPEAGAEGPPLQGFGHRRRSAAEIGGRSDFRRSPCSLASPRDVRRRRRPLETAKSRSGCVLESSSVGLQPPGPDRSRSPRPARSQCSSAPFSQASRPRTPFWLRPDGPTPTRRRPRRNAGLGLPMRPLLGGRFSIRAVRRAGRAVLRRTAVHRTIGRAAHAGSAGAGRSGPAHARGPADAGGARRRRRSARPDAFSAPVVIPSGAQASVKQNSEIVLPKFRMVGYSPIIRTSTGAQAVPDPAMSDTAVPTSPPAAPANGAAARGAPDGGAAQSSAPASFCLQPSDFP
jgi:hypothetical protein